MSDTRFAIGSLTESVATLRSDASARRWPSSAKATVLAAALGVFGTLGAVVLGAPV